MGAASCDLCAHYVYDEEDDFSECMVNMDEDDYARFITSSYESCPYFQLDDEYKPVSSFSYLLYYTYFLKDSRRSVR